MTKEATFQTFMLRDAILRVSNLSGSAWEVSGIDIEMKRRVFQTRRWGCSYDCEDWTVYVKGLCPAVPKAFENFNNTLEAGQKGSPFYFEAPVEIFDLKSPVFQMLESPDWLVRTGGAEQTFYF